jgi:hypothetical protein
MGFLKFSRGFESEADMLGLEYMYKAGYDPTCFVDFFEKIQSLEKRKPGTMSKIFSDHPPTGDRITKSQEIIQKYLKEKPEYVVSTSEFNDVKARTMAMHNRRAIDTAKDAGRPTLRRNPNGQIDSNGNDTPAPSDSDDRPTLKRRDSGSDYLSSGAAFKRYDTSVHSPAPAARRPWISCHRPSRNSPGC